MCSFINLVLALCRLAIFRESLANQASYSQLVHSFLLCTSLKLADKSSVIRHFLRKSIFSVFIHIFLRTSAGELEKYYFT